MVARATSALGQEVGKLFEQAVTESVRSEHLKSEVARVLSTDISTIATRVSSVEILLKTNQSEMILSSFPSVPDAMRALTDLVSDRPDIRTFIESET